MRVERLAVALDTPDWDEFARWTAWFGPRVGVLKVGLEAFLRWGPRAVTEARRHSDAIFLDVKLHDIPNTVAGAVRAARQLEVSYLTVHVGGGAAMLDAAVGAAAGDVDLLGVTVLTHLDGAALADLGLAGGSSARVGAWAALARSRHLAGVVCSPREVADLRPACPRPFLLVTPGIRAAGVGPGDDQKRVATPAEAIAAGADLLVVGRPLTRAANPDAALRRIAAEMRQEPA